MIWMFVMTMAGMLAACGGESSSGDSDSEEATTEAKSADEEEENSEAMEESAETETVSGAGDLGDYYVKIGDCNIRKIRNLKQTKGRRCIAFSPFSV